MKTQARQQQLQAENGTSEPLIRLLTDTRYCWNINITYLFGFQGEHLSRLLFMLYTMYNSYSLDSQSFLVFTHNTNDILLHMLFI